jgi:dethiobiotin synthetase
MKTNANPAWFITGTDTEVGKTFVACALLHALRQTGLSAIGMKPVAAGLDAEGKNDDVEQLIAASSLLAPRDLINPYVFAAAVAPHIAAADEGRTIELARIVAAFEQLRTLADAVLVEGVGGFCVPLGADFDTADLAVALDLPIILVVGMRLGCISHALLTEQAITARGLTLAGWVANCIDPAMSRFDENLAALKERISAPLLGVVAHGTTPEQAAKTLNIAGNKVHSGG